jgi:hypothetical protein
LKGNKSIFIWVPVSEYEKFKMNNSQDTMALQKKEQNPKFHLHPKEYAEIF